MQTNLRENIDGDLNEGQSRASSFWTEQNQHEMKCSICFEDFFVDNITYENISHVIDEGMENPFVCDECSLAYDEEAHDVH